MATSSLCAPLFTADDVERERKSLSPEEQYQVETDIHGHGLCKDVEEPEDEEAMIRAHEAMMQEIDLIPHKSEYMEAMNRCPDIVEKESNPLAFLRCEGLDAKAAAGRLVMYWRLRKRLFGPDAAFRPLLEALEKSDLDALDVGFFMRLFPDAHDRPVFYYCPALMYRFPDRSNRTVRGIFYLLATMALESDHVQRDGFVALHNQTNDRAEHFDRRTARTVKEILHCMPMKLKVSHAILRPDSSSNWTALIRPIFFFLLGKELRLRRQEHYIAERDVATSLAPFGISAAGLPSSLGGTWDRANFAEWVENLRRDVLSCAGKT